MKRNLFDELRRVHCIKIRTRRKKITLKHFTIEKKPELTITPEELLTFVND